MRTIIAPLVVLMTSGALAKQATVISCSFEHLPTMILTIRGGMGAKDNTLQVGNDKPVPLSVGSSLMIAEHGAQELVFSLRMPTNVSISAPGNDTITYYGECITAQ